MKRPRLHPADVLMILFLAAVALLAWVCIGSCVGCAATGSPAVRWFAERDRFAATREVATRAADAGAASGRPLTSAERAVIGQLLGECRECLARAFMETDDGAAFEYWLQQAAVRRMLIADLLEGRTWNPSPERREGDEP